MSRVAKMPVVLPAGVEAQLSADSISIKGPQGNLVQKLSALVRIVRDGSTLSFEAANETRESHALSGTYRALVANMVSGVTAGFQKRLLLVGTGFRAQSQGANLNLSLGFSHPVVYKLPEGVKAETPTQTEILIKGADRQKVGQVAAEIRAHRPPEPYKGKGVRYADELISIKEVKKK